MLAARPVGGKDKFPAPAVDHLFSRIFQQRHEFTHPGRVCRPGRCGDQIALNMGRIHGRGRIDVLAAADSDFRRHRGIAAALTPLQHAGG